MKFKPWHGRPNRPPLNWNTPSHPVIRRVSGSLPDEETSAANPQPLRTDTIEVHLSKSNWIDILKCLTLYAQSVTDESWLNWRKSIREIILLTVNPVTNELVSIPVGLKMEDWQRLLTNLGEVAAKRSQKLEDWYMGLRKEILKQVKLGD